MRKIPTLCWAAAAMSCAEVQPPPPAPTPPRAPSAKWDDAAAKELRAELDKMNTAWDTGDMAAVRSYIATDGTLDIYDFDAQGRPATFTSADEMIRTAEQMMAGMKKMGVSMKQEVKSADCRATGNFGVCIEEYDGHLTMPDGKTQTWSFRGTGTARKAADGWKWTHWHASYAALPPPMPAPPPPPVSMNPRTYDLKKLKWTTPRDAPKGVKVAVVWEHPGTRAQAAFVQFPKKFALAPHHHTPNLWMTVVKGAITVTGPDGKAMEVKAGGFAQAPAGMVHSTESKQGATFFQLTDGPFDTVLESGAGPASVEPAAMPGHKAGGHRAAGHKAPADKPAPPK
jgi:quercetin dioxygenase-like cupin family protein/ketosteroid isomerase-like protein